MLTATSSSRSLLTGDRASPSGIAESSLGLEASLPLTHGNIFIS